MAVVSFETFAKYFSHFSGHMVQYNGTLYTTAEHAYHCQRFTNQKLLNEIKEARSAWLAWTIAQQHKSEQIADWNERKVMVMDALIQAKIAQHDDVRQALLATGSDEIVKNQPDDSFWGNGPDGTGRNEMGKAWMRARDAVRKP